MESSKFLSRKTLNLWTIYFNSKNNFKWTDLLQDIYFAIGLD